MHVSTHNWNSSMTHYMQCLVFFIGVQARQSEYHGACPCMQTAFVTAHHVAMCHATHRGATTRPLQIPTIACCSEHDTHWRLGSVAVPLERKPVCRRARRSARSHSGSVGVGHTQCVVVLAERCWALFESWRCNRRQHRSTCQWRCTCPCSHQNRSHGRSHSHLKSHGLFRTPNHARATVQLDALLLQNAPLRAKVSF